MIDLVESRLITDSSYFGKFWEILSTYTKFMEKSYK